jgi:hypothetical protein
MILKERSQPKPKVETRRKSLQAAGWKGRGKQSGSLGAVAEDEEDEDGDEEEEDQNEVRFPEDDHGDAEDEDAEDDEDDGAELPAVGAAFGGEYDKAGMSNHLLFDFQVRFPSESIELRCCIAVLTSVRSNCLCPTWHH